MEKDIFTKRKSIKKIAVIAKNKKKLRIPEFKINETLRRLEKGEKICEISKEVDISQQTIRKLK